MRRFQAHVDEDSDQEVEEEAKKDEDSSEKYVLISALTGSVSPGNDTWLVDSGVVITNLVVAYVKCIQDGR